MTYSLSLVILVANSEVVAGSEVELIWVHL